MDLMALLQRGNHLNIELPWDIRNAAIIYPYGSRVYGTFRSDSDFDYVVVLNPNEIKQQSLYSIGIKHFQVYSHAEFMLKIENHDIMALECISLNHPGDTNIEYFTLNKNKLRESISTICNNSWVKGKKKLTVSGDYDKLAGMKSVFHSIRILEYGIQIAQYGKILDFKVVNWIWDEIMKLGEKYDADELWNKIHEKFKKTFNETSTRFKALAPKNLDVRDKQRKLKELLEKYGAYDIELLREITEMYSND